MAKKGNNKLKIIVQKINSNIKLLDRIEPNSPAGHGYHSGAKMAYLECKKLLKEIFPDVFPS